MRVHDFPLSIRLKSVHFGTVPLRNIAGGEGVQVKSQHRHILRGRYFRIHHFVSGYVDQPFNRPVIFPEAVKSVKPLFERRVKIGYIPGRKLKITTWVTLVPPFQRGFFQSDNCFGNVRIHGLRIAHVRENQ